MRIGRQENGRPRFSRPILVSMLLTYLCAFLLPFAVTLIHNRLLQSSYQDQELTRGSAVASQLSNLMDSHLTGLQSMSTVLLNSC